MTTQFSDVMTQMKMVWTFDGWDEAFYYYWPVLVALVLFWPVLVTLVAVSVSASAWLFWLCISVASSSLQLVYVLYNFTMIFIDVSVLTTLKTFALLRSFVRFYFHKIGDAGWSERKSCTHRHGKKRRTRREWRVEVEKATNYKEYCSIDLFEPRQTSVISSVMKELDKGSIESPKSPVGLRLRRCSTDVSDASSLSSNTGLNDSPSSKFLRRTISCAPPCIVNYDDGGVRVQQIVQDDMGSIGGMLLSTLSNLKEARIKVLRMKDRHENRDSNERLVEKLDIPDELGNEDENPFGDKLVHFSLPSSLSMDSDEDYSSALKALLPGIIKRNHLSIDDFVLQDARSVAERGQHNLHKETREIIVRYGEEVEKCIDLVASGAVYLGKVDRDNVSTPCESHSTKSMDQTMQMLRDELSSRYILCKRMKQNLGYTALMLSGGGAQAMYHLGTIKALIESNLYQHMHVISGTSGGSITAAMCAIKSPEELLRDVCVNTISTDYMLTGEMKRQKVSWFPSIYKMGEFWMKTGLLMDAKEFLRCCHFYYSDITFEEAFAMTGKHVCISVSASRAYSGSGVQRLLLNHISTPNVTLASAVAASCAVPGVMAPAKLMIKDSKGELAPFEIDGVEWIDGSIQADLPFKRISTLFNISNFVVAQTNFHVVPFLNQSHHPNINTLYWKMFQMCIWDVQARVLNLSKLGLFPKIFGQDLSKMFKQKYYGKLTLVPRFTTQQLLGLKVLSNPTVADMDNYLKHGQVAAWPFLRVVQEMIRIECALDTGLAKLDRRLKSISSGFDDTMQNDDIGALSSSVILSSTKQNSMLLKEKVASLELENKQLRQQLMEISGNNKFLASNTSQDKNVTSVTSVSEEDGQNSWEINQY